MDIIRGVIVNADEFKEDGIISPNKIEEKWVNLTELLEWIRQYETTLGDLPKELQELKNTLSTEKVEK